MALALLGAVQAPTAEEAAFVEWSLPRGEAWRGETLRVHLRFGLQEEVLAERLVQPFRRRLDLPVRLLVPGLDEERCLGAVAAPSQGGLEFALDEDVARVREVAGRELDGARFRVFEYALDLHPTCTGALELPAPELVITTATRFETDVFGNRTPVEPLELVCAGEGVRLDVRALPDAGRPEGFSGGVGTFTLSASAREVRVPVGQGFLFDLHVAGRGDLTAIEPPRLEDLPGLRVRGQLEHLESGTRTFTYELVPTSEQVRTVPAVRLVVFDPERGAWDTLASEPVALEVLPSLSESEGASDGEPEPDRRSWGWLALPAALLIAWLLRGRVAIGTRSDAPLRALRAQAALEEAGGESLERYTRFLATFLACPPPAVVGAHLERRLADAGAPAELAARLAAHHEALTHARYGGGAAPDGVEQALADELATALA